MCYNSFGTCATPTPKLVAEKRTCTVLKENDFMYHISNDKRAIQSSELIYNGLMECIKKKPFDLITISDLQKASGVARTTFYRAFDNLSDVLYWKCDACFYEVLGKHRPELFQGELDLARHYFQY